MKRGSVIVAASLVVIASSWPAGAGAGAITGFSSRKGPAGSIVTITGSGFSSTADVRFGGVRASFTVVSDHKVTATVPARALTGFIAVSTADGTSTSARPFVVQPNIVLILTDDQRHDQTSLMPILQSDLVAQGVQFTPNAIISNPLCCPSRAAILTGTYSHTNHVYGDVSTQSNGGFQTFKNYDEGNTIATVLQAQGYNTALVGKYLNGYTDVTYIPPGWNRWFGTLGGDYFNWTASDQGFLATYGSGANDYITDVLAQKAVDFIDSTPANKPLFLYFAPHAPHDPATPAPKYAGTLAGKVPSLSSIPNFNESNVSDKPNYVKAFPVLSSGKVAHDQSMFQAQFETLLSVDDAIGQFVQHLAADGRLANTLFVFLSDQGIELGSHRIPQKIVPYEEAIRTPLVIRWDALGITPRSDPSLVSNIDLAPTMAAAAGTTMPGAEGVNLIPLLDNPGTPVRTELLLEHATGSGTYPYYCGVRTPGFMYVQYKTGEEELYDLTADPYELTNVASNPAYANVVTSLRADDHVLCNPLPPKFIFKH